LKSKFLAVGLACFLLFCIVPASALAGSISGTVTVEGQVPAEMVVVCALGSGPSNPCEAAEPDGHYTISNVPADEYAVEFRGGKYVTQFWNDKPNWGSADEFQLAEDQDLTGIDADLVTGSEVKGKITAVGGSPIPQAQACLREVGGNGHAICAQANAEGEYAITSIAPDTYKLYFEEPQGGPEYLVNYWPEKATYDEAEVLQIGSDETMEANASLVAAGRIEGTLTTEGEVPSFGEICALKPNGTRVACGYAAGDSAYRIGSLAPGSYIVRFFVVGYRTQFSGGVTEFFYATPVTVQAGAATTSSADLQSYPGISGTVTALDTGEPIENVRVCADEGGDFCFLSTFTDEDGKYDLQFVGGNFNVWFEVDGYVRQYYDDAADIDHATKVSFYETRVRGVDAALEDAGSIKGHVATNDGHGDLGDAEVCALGASSEECVNPDSSGAYEFLSLAPGSYKVRFSLNGYFTQFYDDKATEAEAESVTVTANHESGGVDATLVAEEAPTNIIPPLVSGVGKVGETLSCSNGVWSGNPPSFTYEYFWFRGEEEEIEGAESSTYRLGLADAGESIWCAVVATNSAGTEYEFSSNEIVVAGIATVTVTKSGGGTGTVSSAPGGIDCGVSCSALFDEGTAITLTAVADSGSEFTGWSGDCSGTGLCVFTLGAEAEVVANFAKTRSGGGGSNRASNPPATPAPTTPAPVPTPKKKKPLRCKKGFHKAKHKGKVRCVKAKPKAKKGTHR
jgi:hypothetical protein